MTILASLRIERIDNTIISQSFHTIETADELNELHDSARHITKLSPSTQTTVTTETDTTTYLHFTD